MPALPISVDGVSYTVGEKAILRDVSLEAAAGSTVALLGPSGCGKTTLLRIIAGLAAANSGRVVVGERDLTGVPAHRRRVGMMFQDYALFPHRTVARNVAYGLERSGMAKQERVARVEELLAFVGLEGFEERTVEALSGGERQRVALARTLAPDPGVLLLDEPLGALDRVLREQLLAELKRTLAEVEATAIYVTHDQEEAFALADQLLVMDAGEIVRRGTPAEVYAEPGTVFVARFLGLGNIVEHGWPGLAAFDTGGIGADAVLLRPEGVRLVEGPGTNVVAGIVASEMFRGASREVTIEADGVRLKFEVEAAAEVAPGELAHVLVPGVQRLAGGVDRTVERA